jgi:hypothetical protein
MCSHYVTPEETFPEVGGCSAFKNKGDFVEVVRCKDCKHYFHYGDGVYGCRTFGMMKTKPDGFCSCGERREGE